MVLTHLSVTLSFQLRLITLSNIELACEEGNVKKKKNTWFIEFVIVFLDCPLTETLCVVNLTFLMKMLRNTRERKATIDLEYNNTSADESGHYIICNTLMTYYVFQLV